MANFIYKQAEDDLTLALKQAAHRSAMFQDYATAAALEVPDALTVQATSFTPVAYRRARAHRTSQKTRRTGLSYRQRQARGRAARRQSG